VAYTALVGLFFGSAVAVARPVGGAWPSPRIWAGAAVMWLVFLHLRLFDEHKDAEADRAAYPDRLLTRGVVTLPLLRNVAVVAVLAEAGLSAWLGPRALVAWVVVFAFTLAMRFEFGLGRWLSDRIVWYAVTHNPVVGLLALYAWACTGLPFPSYFVFYVLTVSVASLAFEVARKTRMPTEEVPGVPSYTSVHGKPRVTLWLRMLAVATSMTAYQTIWNHRVDLLAGPEAPLQGSSTTLVVGLGITLVGLFAGTLMVGVGRRGKQVELGGTLLLLLTLLGILVAAW
jgi:4-hydroxybenzoate polyprenyltransferase